MVIALICSTRVRLQTTGRHDITLKLVTFFACTFCFPNTNLICANTQEDWSFVLLIEKSACKHEYADTDHVLILRRFGPLFCSLQRVHAGIFMLACALFNEQNKGPILLSIST